MFALNITLATPDELDRLAANVAEQAARLGIEPWLYAKDRDAVVHCDRRRDAAVLRQALSQGGWSITVSDCNSPPCMGR